MNDKNLKNFKDYSKEELKEISSKGGKQSAKVRTEKRRIKQIFNTILDEPITDEATIQEMQQANLTSFSNKDLACYRIIKKAIEGDYKAFEIMMKILNEQATLEESLENLF